jgi:hypothetical protein
MHISRKQVEMMHGRRAKHVKSGLQSCNFGLRAFRARNGKTKPFVHFVNSVGENQCGGVYVRVL